MRRAAAAVAVAAVAALAVPAAPAYACSPPRGYFDVDRDPLVAGETVGLRGDVVADANGTITPCTTPVAPGPTPTPEPTETASPEPDPGPTSIVTLPPLVPVAYTPPVPPVTVTIDVAYDGNVPQVYQPRVIGTIPPNRNRWYAPGLLLWSFRGRVTIPADLAPGEYLLGAHQKGGVGYGVVPVTIARGLAATGAPTAALLRVALLALLTGAGALRAARLVRQ